MGHRVRRIRVGLRYNVSHIADLWPAWGTEVSVSTTARTTTKILIPIAIKIIATPPPTKEYLHSSTRHFLSGRKEKGRKTRLEGTLFSFCKLIFKSLLPYLRPSSWTNSLAVFSTANFALVFHISLLLKDCSNGTFKILTYMPRIFQFKIWTRLLLSISFCIVSTLASLKHPIPFVFLLAQCHVLNIILFLCEDLSLLNKVFTHFDNCILVVYRRCLHMETISWYLKYDISQMESVQ